MTTKRLLLLLFSAMMQIGLTNADATQIVADASHELIVTFADGSDIRCAFSSEPVLTLTEEGLSLSSSNGNVGQWTISEVASWRVAEIEAVTAVDAVLLDDGIALSAASASPVVVSVFSTDGRLVLRRTLSPADTSSADASSAPAAGIPAAVSSMLSLRSLPHGTYIVRWGSAAAKFIVK